MSRNMKRVAGLLAVIISLFGAMANEGADKYASSQIVLTRDGCAYAQSIGLKTEQDKEKCIMLARYRPYVFGDGGVIILDDDRVISATNNMVLAHRQSAVQLPLTPKQQDERRWFWIWLAMAVTAFAATLVYGYAKPECPNGRQSK